MNVICQLGTWGEGGHGVIIFGCWLSSMSSSMSSSPPSSLSMDHSRGEAALGTATFKHFSSMDILIIGARGVGVETAKVRTTVRDSRIHSLDGGHCESFIPTRIDRRFV